MSAILTMLREKRVERKNILDAAQAILLKGGTEKRSLTAEEDQEWNKRHTDGDRLSKEINQLEKQHAVELELGSAVTDTRSAGREDFQEGSNRQIPADYKIKRQKLQQIEFRAWAQGGSVDRLKNEVRSEHAVLRKEIGSFYDEEVRALSASTGTAGGDTIPTGFVYQLEVALKWFGGIINAAEYINTDMGNSLPWPSINDTTNTGETILENTQVAGSTGGASEQDPVYGVTTFGAYMFDTGFVLVPVQLIQDSAFNLDDYLNEQLSNRIGRRLNTQCTIGTGSGNPTGVLTASSAGPTSISGAGLTYTDLQNLYYSVDKAYRSNPKSGWMFADSTEQVIRKLVDGNGRPLWQAGGVTTGIDQGAPDVLNNKQIWINNDMPAIGVNAKALLYGDFSKYKIRRVNQVQIVKANERFIDKLQIGFIMYQRYDGNIVDAGTHPIKYLLQAAS